MRAIQVTIRLDPDVLAKVDAAAQEEAAACDKMTGRPGHKCSRAAILGTIIGIGLEAWRIEAERLATQAKVLG